MMTLVVMEEDSNKQQLRQMVPHQREVYWGTLPCQCTQHKSVWSMLPCQCTQHECMLGALTVNAGGMGHTSCSMHGMTVSGSLPMHTA